MSRLDSVIRRLEAQRACLNAAAGLLKDLPTEAPVFEVGLGNGRTYDHLRELLPSREIFVFEREVRAHPDCVPDEAHLFLGDFLDCLPRALERFSGRVALIHADIGSGDEAANARLARAIEGFLGAFLLPGGILISDQEMSFEGAESLPPPEGVQADRYHLRLKSR